MLFIKVFFGSVGTSLPAGGRIKVCEWKYSALHGTGKVMSRAGTCKSLYIEKYKKVMEGIYITSVNEDTLDEEPMAYKSLRDITDDI